jgi:hypothetical protein
MPTFWSTQEKKFEKKQKEERAELRIISGSNVKNRKFLSVLPFS